MTDFIIISYYYFVTFSVYCGLYPVACVCWRRGRYGHDMPNHV